MVGLVCWFLFRFFVFNSLEPSSKLNSKSSKRFTQDKSVLKILFFKFDKTNWPSPIKRRVWLYRMTIKLILKLIERASFKYHDIHTIELFKCPENEHLFLFEETF